MEQNHIHYLLQVAYCTLNTLSSEEYIVIYYSG